MGQWNTYESELDKIVHAGTITHQLSQRIASGGTDLSYIPKMIVDVISEDLWQHFRNKFEVDVYHERFIDYVTDKRPR